jgi:hypothetical protein
VASEMISFRAPKEVREALRKLAQERFGNPALVGPVLLPRILEDLRAAKLLPTSRTKNPRQ